jgi:hypothetical protein
MSPYALEQVTDPGDTEVATILSKREEEGAK